MIVTTPETPSVQSAYNFIRICMFRSLYSTMARTAATRGALERARVPTSDGKVVGMRDLVAELERTEPGSTDDFRAFQHSFAPYLVLNMVLKNEETRGGWGIREVVKRYLDVDVNYVGSISFDKVIRESVANEIPYIINSPNARPSGEFYSLTAKMLDGADHDSLREILHREAAGRARPTRRGHPVAVHGGRSIHHLADRNRDADTPDRRESPGAVFSGRARGQDRHRPRHRQHPHLRTRPRGDPQRASLMSIDETSGKIVAIGRDAKAMLGRSHSAYRSSRQ